jgi:hypothetical protein
MHNSKIIVAEVGSLNETFFYDESKTRAKARDRGPGGEPFVPDIARMAYDKAENCARISFACHFGMVKWPAFGST